MDDFEGACECTPREKAVVVLQTTSQEVASWDGIEMATRGHPVSCTAKGMGLFYFFFLKTGSA